MPNIGEEKTYAGITADEGFKLALEVLPLTGFEIWKTRPMGWLIITNRETQSGAVNATVAFRPGTETAMTISLASDTAPEDEIRKCAEEFLLAFEQRLQSS
jgi:hypothetical protein